MPAHRTDKPGTADAQSPKSSEKQEKESTTAGKVSGSEARVSSNPDTAEGSREEVDKSLDHDSPSENGNGQTLH